MNYDLAKMASAHGLEETMYVRIEEDPEDEDEQVYTANDNTETLLGGDEEMIVGVYRLVAVERVSRKRELFTEVLS